MGLREQELSINARKQLEELANSDDPEAAHGIADGILLELLDKLGFYEVTEAWKTVPKWYA